MINFIAKFIAKFFIKKPRKNLEDLTDCVKNDILTKEEMLRIKKDRAIRNWEIEAKGKKKK